jgi:hypothetical protein
MTLNEVLRPCYLVIDQLAFLTADFSAILGVLPLPRLRVSAPRSTTFTIVVVCIMVNLQLQLLKVTFHVVLIV